MSEPILSRSQTAALAASPVPLAPAAAQSAPRLAAVPAPQDSPALGTLRGVITLLVLAHHAVLAYHPDAPPAAKSLLAQPRWWEAFPVVDPARWAGFRLFVGWNDSFFMALMFFLSGLFVWESLKRRGSEAFLRHRAFRLGLPFLAAAALVAPLAYATTYLQATAQPSLGGFVRQWLALREWPAGPAWFLWVLLTFDAVAALLFSRFPGLGEALGRFLARRRPAAFFLLLAGGSAAVYIPILLVVGPMQWVHFGPFYFQTSRFLLYLVYFLAGVALGAAGIENGLLARNGALARRWLLWSCAAFFAFALEIVLTVLALAPHASPRAWGIPWGLSFALSSAASSLALVALFLRFAGKRGPVSASLRANAYGMYLLHYAFAAWLQLALLQAPLSGLAKGTLVTLGTIALAWGATAGLRRVPGVARVI